MYAPIALQLYTVRDAIAASNYEDVVRKVAAMGYAGVEPAGFPGTDAQTAAKLFQELGLSAPSAHAPMPLGDDKNMVLDMMGTIGAKQITSPAYARDSYGTVDGIKAAADTFNEANAVARDNGFTFAVHNHWWEFQDVDGTNAFDILLDHVDDTVHFQLDTYWIQTAGVDAASTIAKLGNRAPTLHIKDGPCTVEGSMTALGTGSMDIGSLIAAGGSNTEWVIVELDRCDTDMVVAVEESINYLIKEGYGHGKES
ncbi:MAG: sugar phosphate isomerase/epimerase [Chloroflexota bacterium]